MLEHEFNQTAVEEITKDCFCCGQTLDATYRHENNEEAPIIIQSADGKETKYICQNCWTKSFYRARGVH